MVEQQEYLIKVYRKGEEIEYGNRLGLPEEIRNVHTRVLTKEKWEEFKKTLNEYTKFINEEIDKHISFLEEKLRKGPDKQFELKTTISIQLKKKISKEEKGKSK